MSEAYFCAFCGGPLTKYDTGRSEYDFACDACGASFDPDVARGVARSRRWDRQAARGIHDEFPLERLKQPPSEG